MRRIWQASNYGRYEGSIEGNSTLKPRTLTRYRALGFVVMALLLAVLTLAACSSAPGEDGASAGGTCSTNSSQSTLSILHLRSPDLSGGEREVWVYRPNTPDTETLPVLYVLHGLPGGPEDFFTKSVCDYLDARVAAGHSQFVVVAPDGNGAVHPDTEWADSEDGEDRLESFVTEVVVHAVEGAHPRDRYHRAIAGFSMGGYGATNLAFRHPDLFGQLVSIAGYYHVDDPDGVFGGVPALIEANSPDQNLNRARNIRIMLLGFEGEDQPLARGEVARFHTLLEDAGVPSTTAYAPGDHDLSYALDQWPTEVAFVEDGWEETEDSSLY